MSLSAILADVVVVVVVAVRDVTSVPYNHRDWMTRLFATRY